MKATPNAPWRPCLVLPEQTAADLMTVNPVSLRADATVAEALALLTDKGISAAPVIDDTGRPVGVLSTTDLLVHDREGPAAAPPRAPARPGVRGLMTPAVFSVAPHGPAERVVEELLALKVRRLFVVDHAGVLVGVISAADVLRRLRRPEPE